MRLWDKPLYLSKLQPSGVIVFHISNRYLDLGPVVANVAASLDLAARRNNDDDDNDERSKEGDEPTDSLSTRRRPSE